MTTKDTSPSPLFLLTPLPLCTCLHQTSSGKTHTMLGGGDQRGILDMAAEDIFRQIADCDTRDFLLRVSFVEIYNETIRDLLSHDTDGTVAIREDPKKVT